MHPQCLIGCDGFVSAFVFAVATQQTIGASVQLDATSWIKHHWQAQMDEERGTRRIPRLSSYDFVSPQSSPRAIGCL